MLFLVATPIGNLQDITLRALETLKKVDEIICEDTRRAAILLNHYQVQKPLYVVNDFNEASKVDTVIEKLKLGQNIALISDAGTPIIADPGFKIVKKCIDENIPVDSIPGPVSPVLALTLSGLPPTPFMFLGYPPDKPGHRKTLYNKISQITQITPTTMILFVAPFKLLKTLEEMKESLGDIEIVLAKELTKIHQFVKTQAISKWLEFFSKTKPKGEYILLLRKKD